MFQFISSSTTTQVVHLLLPTTTATTTIHPYHSHRHTSILPSPSSSSECEIITEQTNNSTTTTTFTSSTDLKTTSTLINKSSCNINNSNNTITINPSITTTTSTTINPPSQPTKDCLFIGIVQGSTSSSSSSSTPPSSPSSSINDNNQIGASPTSSSPSGTESTTTSTTSHRHPKINVGFNFASEEAGAKILSSNREAKKVSRILNEDSDKYCLIPRSVPKKWIVVELSEEILMKSIAIANYEYYSCSFKHFKVWGSVKYPCSNKERSTCWELLGTFQTAANSRKVQHFTLKKPSITRYVKLEFLSHYGESEYYCTMSLLRVHGSTLLEDLKKSLQKSSKKSSSETTSIGGSGGGGVGSGSEQTSSTNHGGGGSIEYDIRKEEANLSELIKENTEQQIVSIHNSDLKENSKRLDQLEESFGKLLNDDISNLIKEQMSSNTYVVSSRLTQFWAMQIKKKYQSYTSCSTVNESDRRGAVVVVVVEPVVVIPLTTTNCTAINISKKDFIERVGFLKYYSHESSNGRGISLYSNRTTSIVHNTSHHHHASTASSSGATGFSGQQKLHTFISPNNKKNGGESICQNRISNFSWKCVNVNAMATAINMNTTTTTSSTTTGTTTVTSSSQQEKSMKKPITPPPHKETKKKPTTNKPIVVVAEDESEVLDQEKTTPMKSNALSHLLNEKQNILKSLFNAIKIHGENENILRNQIKSLEVKNSKTFQYIHQILEKNGEDHKLIANSFISLSQKNREQIINEMKLEIENKLKHKIEQFSSTIDQKILKLAEENAERMAAIRREVLNYGFVAIVVILILIISTRLSTPMYGDIDHDHDESSSSRSRKKQKTEQQQQRVVVDQPTTTNIKPHNTTTTSGGTAVGLEIKGANSLLGKKGGLVSSQGNDSSLLGILYSFFFQVGIRDQPVSPEQPASTTSTSPHSHSGGSSNSPTSPDSFKNPQQPSSSGKRSKRRLKTQD